MSIKISVGEVERKWVTCALSTEAANREEAERGINAAYQAARRAPPEKILWCLSPYEALMTIAYLKARHWRRLWRVNHSRYPESLWQTFQDHFLANFGDSLTDPFWDEIGDKVNLSLSAPEHKNTSENDIWQTLVSQFRELDRRFGANIERVVSNEFFPDEGELDVVPQLMRMWEQGEFIERQDWNKTGGQHDIQMLTCYDCWREVFGFGMGDAEVEAHGQIARSAGWWWAFKRLCIITERPSEIHLDVERRLHNENGAALVFRDGWQVFSWHGVRVPANAILEPQSITVAQIENQRNMETRRVLMERYGMDRFLRDSGAEEVHRDQFGVLYKQAFFQQEPIVLVKVTNSTPELDGSYREYFIRVPPSIQTAHHAVAWTFGFKKSEYRPYVES